MSSESSSPDGPDLPQLLRERIGVDEPHRAEQLSFFDIGHDKKAAAQCLGVSLSSLYRKLEELEIGASTDDPAEGR